MLVNKSATINLVNTVELSDGQLEKINRIDQYQEDVISLSQLVSNHDNIIGDIILETVNKTLTGAVNEINSKLANDEANVTEVENLVDTCLSLLDN